MLALSVVEPTAPFVMRERPWVSVFDRQPSTGARVEIEVATVETVVTIPLDPEEPIRHTIRPALEYRTVLWYPVLKRDTSIKRWRYALSGYSVNLNKPRTDGEPLSAAASKRAAFVPHDRACLKCGGTFQAESAFNRLCPPCKGELPRSTAGSMG